MEKKIISCSIDIFRKFILVDQERLTGVIGAGAALRYGFSVNEIVRSLAAPQHSIFNF
jgi:hypothetical protein